MYYLGVASPINTYHALHGKVIIAEYTMSYYYTGSKLLARMHENKQCQSFI